MKGERTTRLLSCFVGGTPATKGSYRPVTNRASGKTLLVGMNRNEHAWRRRVAAVVRSQWFREHPSTPMPCVDEPLLVVADFYLPRPKSVHRALPSVSPDIDKLARCLLDALTDSRLIKDDSRIVSLDTTKHYATCDEEIGVGLTVRTIHTKDTKEQS